jgi:hypothetical protein
MLSFSMTHLTIFAHPSKTGLNSSTDIVFNNAVIPSKSCSGSSNLAREGGFNTPE